MQSNSRYPAKLLLFGEHILLKGAQAMAVPVPAFYGEWQQCIRTAPPEQWYQLAKMATGFEGIPHFNFLQMQADITDGLYFSSNIPQGYGLGSSGALCAALYDRYTEVRPGGDLVILKNELGRLEGTFHGKSSGIDPLTSYLQKPLMINNSNDIQVLPDFKVPEGIYIFLADTGQPRQTGVLVNWFLDQCLNDSFANYLYSEVFPAHHAMLNAWQEGNTKQFMIHLQMISNWQLHHLQPMLPNAKPLLHWWETGITQGTTLLKICGAGGGGYVLGCTTNPGEVLQRAEEIGIPVIFPFNTDK